MESLLKRHFWAVNLLGLGVVAWLTAAAVNALVGVQLAKASQDDVKVKSDAAAGESALAERLRKGRVGPNSGAEMSGQSMFLLPEPKVEAEPEPEPEPETGAEEKQVTLTPSFEDTTLPVKLMGTIVVTPDSWSSASLEVEKTSQKVVNVGSEVLGGQATVYAIRRNYIVLKEGDKLTVARLFPKDSGAAGAATAAGGAPADGQTATAVRPAPTPATAAPAKPEGTPDPAGVKKLADGAYQLDRSHVNDKLKDVTQLGQQVRIVPNYRNGKYEGFRMIGMGAGSLFSDIGFNNGDIVKSVNGEQIDSPNKALTLYDALKTKSRLTVLIEHDGQPQTLRYTIR